MGEGTLALDGELGDPVLGSQRLFRMIMAAMAQPGSRQPLSPLAEPPPPLTPELGAVALTLADHDTPIWLDARLRNFPSVVDWLHFHTGAPIVSDPALAVFALADATQVLPAFADFNQGSDEYPDRSATLMLAISRFEAGPRLTLRGPGILEAAVIAPAGLPQGFIRQWHENRARFPRGVDVMLVAGGHVLGLPRSTRIATEPV